MEQIERIQHYETLLDRIAPVLENLEEDDFEADDAGKLPKDLKRGVLSEDGIYDVLSDHYALTVRLLDTVSAILKNR